MDKENNKNIPQKKAVKNKEKSAKKPLNIGGIFGLPHILMGVGILAGYGFVPLLLSVFRRIICNASTGGGVAGNFVSADICFLFSTLAALVIYVAVSCFAYKNLGGALRFLGVVFLSTGIISLVKKFIEIIVSAIGSIFIKSYVGFDGVLDAISANSVIPGIIVDFVFILGHAVVAAALGVAILVLISKLAGPMKSRKSKKAEKKEKAEATK